MSQPTREEVQAFIDALKYGMKVTHKPEFLIALAEAWIGKEQSPVLSDAVFVMTNNAAAFLQREGFIYDKDSLEWFDPSKN